MEDHISSAQRLLFLTIRSCFLLLLLLLPSVTTLGHWMLLVRLSSLATTGPLSPSPSQPMIGSSVVARAGN